MVKKYNEFILGIEEEQRNFGGTFSRKTSPVANREDDDDNLKENIPESKMKGIWVATTNWL